MRIVREREAEGERYCFGGGHCFAGEEMALVKRRLSRSEQNVGDLSADGPAFEAVV